MKNSHLVLLFDGVSIGARMFSRYESLLLIGVVVLEDKGDGQWSEAPHLLAAPSVGQKHAGVEQAELILQSLADHPAHLTPEKLAARLGLVGSDGAACAGGEHSIHTGTEVSEKVWSRVHPGADHSSLRAATATEWDLFHRLDRAVAKAIESTPAAVAIFDVSRVMGSLFGVGDGRVILRSVADAIGERRYRVPDQGGTRKIVALANTVEHLLKMHRTLHAAMHARIGQTRAGRSSQTITKLVDVGHQISALDFVTFSIGVGDVLRTCITPLAMQAQQVEGSAREMNLACRSALEKLTKAHKCSEQLQFWCFAATLLCTRLSRKDIKALWIAVALPGPARLFPRLALSLRQLLFAREFGGTPLSVALPADHDSTGLSYHTVSPCCQCACMRVREAPRVVKVTVRKSRSIDSPQWEIKVPEWVAYSVYPKKEMIKSRTQEFAVPRCARVPMEEHPPLQLQGFSRFRTGVTPCRCCIPQLLLYSSHETLQALHELKCFIHRVIYYVEAYAVGDTGVNQDMRAITEANFLCWDFGYLLRAGAKKEHYEAFFDVAQRLRPVLQKALRPRGPEFGFVSGEWPLPRGPNGWFQQYKTLNLRLRAAAKSRWKFRDWWRIARFTIQPVLGCGRLRRVSRSTSSWPQLQHISPARRACVLFLICEFEGRAGVSAAGPFEVAPSSLVVVGTGGRKGKRRSSQAREAQQFRGSEGSFASLLSPGRGKLVQIQALDWQLDESRLASSLLTDKTFVFPDTSGAHCWHVVRVFMRCRLKAPESVCERWGSLMHMLWDSVGGWQPHRIVSRLFMRESRLLHQPAAYKLIVDEIARKLYHVNVMKPYFNARHALEEDSEDEESDADDARVVRTSLRENTNSKEWWRLNSCPVGLLPSAQDAVSKALKLNSVRGALAPLPLHGADAAATPSVRASKMAKWLNTEDGMFWRMDRKALFPGCE